SESSVQASNGSQTSGVNRPELASIRRRRLEPNRTCRAWAKKSSRPVGTHATLEISARLPGAGRDFRPVPSEFRISIEDPLFESADTEETAILRPSGEN